VVELGKHEAKVELGEGLVAPCALPKEQKKAQEPAGPATTDVSSLSAMLSAKWKQGKTLSAEPGREPARAGQVRTFRITALDARAKRIELELV
jgi:small subunit ribosomal protein S1